MDVFFTIYIYIYTCIRYIYIYNEFVYMYRVHTFLLSLFRIRDPLRGTCTESFSGLLISLNSPCWADDLALCQKAKKSHGGTYCPFNEKTSQYVTPEKGTS